MAKRGRRSSLLRGAGREGAVWATHPPDDATLQAALEKFGHEFALVLSHQGLTALDLSTALGQTSASWRHKMNGTRSWKLEDVLAIVLTFNVPPPDPFWRPAAEPDELVPPPYRSMLRRVEPGRMPLLSHALPWPHLIRDMSEWIVEGTASGWASTIVAATATRELLRHLDTNGLPLDEVTVRSDWLAEPPRAEAWWPNRATRILVNWAQPLNLSPPDEAFVIAADMLFANDLDIDCDVFSVVFAPHPVVANLASTLKGMPESMLSSAEAKTSGFNSGLSPEGRTIQLLAAHGIGMCVQVR